jgi:hypothetical protein
LCSLSINVRRKLKILYKLKGKFYIFFVVIKWLIAEVCSIMNLVFVYPAEAYSTSSVNSGICVFLILIRVCSVHTIKRTLHRKTIGHWFICIIDILHEVSIPKTSTFHIIYMAFGYKMFRSFVKVLLCLGQTVKVQQDDPCLTSEL